MCQKALQMLKEAVKNTGEHKQKITIKVNLDGVTLIDAASHVSIDSFNFLFCGYVKLVTLLRRPCCANDPQAK